MKFLKIFLAALLACIVSSVFGLLIWVVVIFGAIGSLGMEQPVQVTPNSVLKITLDEGFTEAPTSDPLAQIDFNTFEVRPTITLLQTLAAIESATYDDNIKCIYLRPSIYSTVGAAAVEEIRGALLKFKESGKPIIAYNDMYSQVGYYLSSVADKVYLQPEGMVMWQGMSSNPMFYKGLLDKLDISVEVFRPTACRYKSAVEPYILDKMSDENRAQMQQLLTSMWGTIASDVALARGLTLDQVNSFADNLDCFDADGALESRMVDELIYEDQLTEIFEELGVEVSKRDKSINSIEFADYITSTSLAYRSIGADKVAIIYAEGTIVDGDGYEAKVYGDATAALVKKARYDKGIKAVVLRVNSPGGSALASDVMWRELELLRHEKPLVVSMGSYAASGGYYISAPADIIVANRLTVTGSIGVFGMLPNLDKSLKNKLGITVDNVSTNSSSNFMSPMQKMSQFEQRVMIKSVDKVYDHFTELVSEGRNLPLDDVLEIAQGRVWSGADAVELGLADKVGGFHDAINLAINKAGIADNYRIVELSSDPTGLAALFATAQTKIKAFVGEVPLVDEYERVREVLSPINTEHGLVSYRPYNVTF